MFDRIDTLYFSLARQRSFVAQIKVSFLTKSKNLFRHSVRLLFNYLSFIHTNIYWQNIPKRARGFKLSMFVVGSDHFTIAPHTSVPKVLCLVLMQKT